MVMFSCSAYLSFLSKTTRFMKNFCFLPLSSVAGEALADGISTNLSQIRFDLNFLRGQGYDRTSNMNGVCRGVQARARMLHLLTRISAAAAIRIIWWSLALRIYLRLEMQLVLLQAVVFLFRGLRSVQLFCESSSKRKHQHLVEKASLYLCGDVDGWNDTILLSHFISRPYTPLAIS